MVGKGYVTLTFPLNTTEYNKFTFMNLVHPQFVNLKSASGATAVFSIDYIYIGPQEFFPRQDDTLFFDFTNTAADRDRYNSITYNHLNFDDPSNWTVYNGSPMSTIADGALKLAVPTGNTDTSHSTRSRIDNVSALHFVPGKNDILQVRIQIKNAVATTDNGVATFRMDLDRPNAIVNSAGTSRTWTNIPINFTLADYVDKGWFILETKLTDAEYLASDWINLVHPQFMNMKNASGKTAEFLIDYIYIGPAEKNPTVSKETVVGYDPTNDENALYFGFGNTREDQQRYSTNPVYGGANYDVAGALRTQNFYNGSGAVDFPVSGIQSIDNELGTVTTKLNGPYPTESSYAGNVSRRFVFGETNDTAESVGSLQYHPANAEVFQVRFALENLKLRSDIDTVDPQARARSIALRYYKNNDTSATLNTNTYGDATVNGKYMTVTLPLDDAFTSAEVITKLLVEFHGFVKADDSKDAYVTLDYVYVGPEATMPTREDSYLLFDFSNSAAAQYRYASNNYSGINFDRIENWWDNGDVASKSISGGSLHFTSKSLPSKSWHYLGTGNGNEDSANRSYPLHHIPSEDDYCEVRFKLDGARPLTENGNLSFRLECFHVAGSPDDVITVTHYFNADKVGNGYFTIYFPLGTNASYMAIPEIVRFNALINSVAYGDVITAEIDYIYIGSPETMPTPHQYQESVTEPTCTEAGSKTYTCTDCGFSYTEIIPVLGHSYEYTDNGANHTKTCGCGYSVEEAHSYTEGKCICGQAEIKEPIEETTWKMGHTLNLASDISVSLAIGKSSLAGFDMDTVYVLAELDTYEGNTKTGVKTIKIMPEVKGSYYYFTLNGLSAVKMSDRIRSVLYGTKDGQIYYSPVDDYSIADYAYSQMKKATASVSLKTLCADLLRYGAKAQIFKNYRTDNLADADMTEEQKSFLSDPDSVVFGNTNTVLNDVENAPMKWEGKALDLASKVTIKFIFSMGTYTGDIADLTLKVSYEDVNGQAKALTLSNGELYNSKYNFYAFTLDTLLAAELRSVLSVQIFEGETPVSCTLQYTADTYGNNKTGALGDLCKALFAYSDSAKVYFGTIA